MECITKDETFASIIYRSNFALCETEFIAIKSGKQIKTPKIKSNKYIEIHLSYFVNFRCYCRRRCSPFVRFLVRVRGQTHGPMGSHNVFWNKASNATYKLVCCYCCCCAVDATCTYINVVYWLSIVLGVSARDTFEPNQSSGNIRHCCARNQSNTITINVN